METTTNKPEGNLERQQRQVKEALLNLNLEIIKLYEMGERFKIYWYMPPDGLPQLSFMFVYED
ncbi:hypothetical protein FACS1894153_0510 [Bacteroidia bacterium]|nr:hypothetical protein FACS1894153_0510 [Bacteroidia bacterium]